MRTPPFCQISVHAGAGKCKILRGLLKAGKFRQYRESEIIIQEGETDSGILTNRLNQADLSLADANRESIPGHC